MRQQIPLLKKGRTRTGQNMGDIPTHVKAKGNVLGDLRAEHDHNMLGLAFYKSPDYRSLIESGDLPIIVGRRGTGKSALFYQVKKQFKADENCVIIEINPEEHEMLGLYDVVNKVGENYNLAKAAIKLSIRYMILMEIATTMRTHYRFNTESTGILSQHLELWRRGNEHPICKIKRKIEPVMQGNGRPEGLISQLATVLDLDNVTEAINVGLKPTNKQIYVFVDRLDEGYEATKLKTGAIGGVAHAVVDMHKRIHNTKVFTFLRDDIFRAIGQEDTDYTRQIEGQIIRLHWDAYDLLQMVALRMKIAFGCSTEASQHVWDQYTCRELTGNKGFERCLKLTLYRPRDLLVLLNKAFYHANSQNRIIINWKDLEGAAQEISQNRLNDLHKEYEATFPGVQHVTRRFANSNGRYNTAQIKTNLRNIGDTPMLSITEQQNFAILKDREGFVDALYGIGFIGSQASPGGPFAFCHDGSEDQYNKSEDTILLVHPCYWRALNISGSDVEIETCIEDAPIEAKDDAQIIVTSKTPKIREARIGEIIARMGEIKVGPDNRIDFADWTMKALGIAYAGGLREIEDRGYIPGTTLRQVWARNTGVDGIWGDLVKEHSAKWILWAVQNDPAEDEIAFRAIRQCLSDCPTKIAFLVSRAEDENLTRGAQLDGVRSIAKETGVIIVKITGKWLARQLSKLRAPQKHDQATKALSGIIKRYKEMYISKQGAKIN